MIRQTQCRFCDAPLTHEMCDLGMSPLANSYVPFEGPARGEVTYPLKVRVCEHCLLAQLEAFETPDAIFSDYAYFSSFSPSWVEHARQYCTMMTQRFGLSASSQVVEIASNDGYLLQHFMAAGIPVLGVEPAANVARAAWDRRRIPCLIRFFGVETAREIVARGRSADLIVGNNVLAHVPDLHDFVGGLPLALKPGGVATFEFPHLMRLIEGNQFDTIYHEHFSYFSFLAAERIFARHGMTVFDVEELPTHGGSLRVFARHASNTAPACATTTRVEAMRRKEEEAGLTSMETYSDFAKRVANTKHRLLEFLIEAKETGRSVAAYGAAAKGVTLLNYCGAGRDLIDYVVDKSHHKQNHYMPGLRIPIHPPDHVLRTRPDYLLILPWNLATEISTEMAAIREWGGRFVVPIPTLRVLDPRARRFAKPA